MQTQTYLWMILFLFTCGMAAPFFGYFYFKLIINHVTIEEVVSGPEVGAACKKP